MTRDLTEGRRHHGATSPEVRPSLASHAQNNAGGRSLASGQRRRKVSEGSLLGTFSKTSFRRKKKVERNPTALHGKNTQQKGIKGNFLTRMKGIYRKSQRTSDSVNGERLNALSLRSGTRQECLLWPLLFNILQVLADRQVKERKGLQIGESVPSFRSARVGATRGRAGIRSWRHSSRVCSKCLSQPTCPGNQDQSELQK